MRVVAVKRPHPRMWNTTPPPNPQPQKSRSGPYLAFPVAGTRATFTPRTLQCIREIETGDLCPDLGRCGHDAKT